MDDHVWEDLSLSSLNHHRPAATISAAAQPPVSELDFQDFFSYPLNQKQILPSTETHDEQKKSCVSSSVSIPQIKTRASYGSCGDENARDRKRIRLMKNRESASRSRARKQAYTYELELEVAHLLKENARLKQQQEKQCVAAGDEPPKKHKLYRTLTAPF
ncbi:protein FD-like [Henckelia pumila]|uniref:protein FD-like n=1 Tax=Henckelia pumila TaxID=405737 RepID=UPI003C6E6462